jgi:hypothetical protein
MGAMTKLAHGAGGTNMDETKTWTYQDVVTANHPLPEGLQRDCAVARAPLLRMEVHGHTAPYFYGTERVNPEAALSRLYERAKRTEAMDAELEALKADNAALLKATSGAVDAFEWIERVTQWGVNAVIRDVAMKELVSGRATIAEQPHPGAALLEELHDLRAQVATLQGECETARQERDKLLSLEPMKELRALRAQVAALEETRARQFAILEDVQHRGDPVGPLEARAETAETAERQREAAQAALSAAQEAAALATAEMERVTLERDHWKAQAALTVDQVGARMAMQAPAPIRIEGVALDAVERLVDVARRLAGGASTRVVWDDLDAALAAYESAKGLHED